MSDGEPSSSDASESEVTEGRGTADDPMGADALLTEVCGLPEARALGDLLAGAGEEARREITNLLSKLRAGRAGRGLVRRGGKKASVVGAVGAGSSAGTKA